MANFADLMLPQISHNVQDEVYVLENNFRVCQSTAVDKERLYKAVRLRSKGAEVDFAFGKQLLHQTTLNPLKVDKLGKIPIPVSIKDIQRLKETSQISYCGKGYNKFLDSSKKLALEIDAAKIFSTTAEDLSLSSLVMHHLDLPSELMNVRANLDQLIVYESGCHYNHIMELEKECGSFGTMILQLPVEGGHEGGRFKVKYQGKEQVYENHKDSDRCFYVSSFYGNSQHSMESITRGARLTLTFSLVWENIENIIPKDFPVFLTALKEIKGSLPSWIPNRKAFSKMKNIKSTKSNEVTSIETVAVACSSEDQLNEKLADSISLLLESKEDSVVYESSEVTPSELFTDVNDQHTEQTHLQKSMDEWIQDFGLVMGLDVNNSNQQDEDVDRCVPLNQDFSEVYEIGASVENVLYFVLEEKYVENDFSFRRLRGKDRKLAQLLQACGFLDTHLAVVTQTVSRSVANCDSRHWRYSCDHEKVKSSTEITRWVDSKDVSKKLSIDLNWKNQCVGPLRKLPTSDRTATDSENECDCGECHDEWDMSTNEEYIHHFILAIWPKHHSFQMYCRYGLNSLLDNIEIKISSSRWLKKNRQKATEDLRTIISFCCIDPRKVWSQKGSEGGELTLRLLRLCVDLRACEEGLRLLKIISSDFCLPQERVSNTQEIFEGIKTEQVAEAIAELECRVTGWKNCADLIKQMISPARIVKQLEPIIKLAQFFLNFDCFEGAKLVGDHISSSVINFDKQQALKIKQPEILSYIELIISLEGNAETANRERISSLASLFSKLEPSMQCYVVLELEAQASSRFKDMKSCNVMFQDLCKTLTVGDLRSSSIKDNLLVDLICCFFRIGNAEWLKSLISNIFHAQVTSEDNKFRSWEKTLLLEKVISSPVILELSLSSELGVSIMASLIDNQLASLTNQLHTPAHRFQPSNETQVLLSLSSCLRFVIRMEKNTRVVDSQRSLSISSLLAKLNVHQLTMVLTDILKSSSERFKKYCSSITVIRHICDSLISRLKDNTVMLSRNTILQSVKALIELSDESLTQTFLKQVCEKEETASWSKKNKFSLLNDLIYSSPDVWGKLDCTSKQLIMNTSCLLVHSWIEEICRLLVNSSRGPSTSNWNSATLNESIINCVQLFFLVEKNRAELEEKITAQVFQPLISQLNGSQLLELVLKLYQSEVALRPNIKKFPACIDWYRGICRILFAMKYVSLVNLEIATKIVHCLLWLEDEQSWQSFALTVCTSFSVSQSHIFLRVFLKNVAIQLALKDSSPAFAAFVCMVDHWVQQSASLTEPSFSWHQPEAVVLNHPEVETFLRSSIQSMTYMKFSGIAEARQFAATLERMGHSNNFGVSVTSSGIGKYSQCVIMKNRDHFEQTRRNFLSWKTELVELLKLRNRIGQENLRAKQLADAISSEPITTDEVHIVPPPKRPKLNIPVVELE